MSEIVYQDGNVNIAKYCGPKGYRQAYQIETRDGHIITLQFIDED